MHVKIKKRRFAVVSKFVFSVPLFAALRWLTEGSPLHTHGQVTTQPKPQGKTLPWDFKGLIPSIHLGYSYFGDGCHPQKRCLF